MNCRPGDLAYIVRSDFEENVGRPVEVLNLGQDTREGWVWYVASSSLLVLAVKGDTARYSSHMRVRDCDLRPISAPPAERAKIAETFDPLYTALGISR